MNASQRAAIGVGVLTLIIAIVFLLVPSNVTFSAEGIGRIDYDCGSVLTNSEEDWIATGKSTVGITLDEVAVPELCSNAIDKKKKFMAGFAILGALIGVGGMYGFRTVSDPED